MFIDISSLDICNDHCQNVPTELLDSDDFVYEYIDFQNLPLDMMGGYREGHYNDCQTMSTASLDSEWLYEPFGVKNQSLTLLASDDLEYENMIYKFCDQTDPGGMPNGYYQSLNYQTKYISNYKGSIIDENQQPSGAYKPIKPLPPIPSRRHQLYNNNSK